MTLTLRFWDFDMDSDVLGPIRCVHFDAEKKFYEFEDSIRTGTVDSTALARNIFQTVARRRTGDAAIDAKCGGGKFSEEEVSTIPSDELDQFCDKLMKGRLRLVATAAGAEPPPIAPAITPGREGLAPVLLHVAERSRAAMKRTVEAAERTLRADSVFEAQRAAAGGEAVERAMREIRGSEELFRGAIGTENLLKSALGQTSMSAATQALADTRRNDDMVKAALGIDDRMTSFLDQTSMSAATQALADTRRNEDMVKAALGIDDRMTSFLDQTSMSTAAQAIAGIGRNEDIFKAAAGIEEQMKSILGPTSMSAAAQAGAALWGNQDIARAASGIDDHLKTALGGHSSAKTALEAMAGVRSLEEAARSFTGRISPAFPDLGGSPEVAPAFPVSRLEITPHRMFVPPPNPVHKTNEMFEKLLVHQKAEAGKKDADRSEATIESADNKKIAKSGLLHTKASVWLALIAFVVPLAWGVWVYWDAKADALENEKKSEIHRENEKKYGMQLEELRTEIRALKASKSDAEPPAKTPGRIAPGVQAGGMPR